MANGSPSQGRVSETRFSLLEQRVGGIESALHGLTEKIDVWMTSRNQNPWKILAIFLGVLVPLGWLLNMYITTAFSPIAATANQTKSTVDSLVMEVRAQGQDVAVSKVNDAQSMVQRGQHEARIANNTDAIAETLKLLAADHSERLANEREVETQIDATAQYQNSIISDFDISVANIQNALHEMGAKMPLAPNLPRQPFNISNRNHRKQ